MIFLTVVWGLSTLVSVHCGTVSSPQIRILDVATKASETRLIPHRVDYRNPFYPHFQQPNRYEQNDAPPKSYVIYDEYPVKIFKEWKAEPSSGYPASGPQNILELSRQQNADFPPDYYFQNGQQMLPPPKPTLAYRSVYSNVIKVFDNSLDGLGRGRFPSDRYIKPLEGNGWKSQLPFDYEAVYPRRQQPHRDLPENFPNVFMPNEKFHFPSFEPPRFFYPREGYYDTYTVNYNKEDTRHRDEVELLPDVAVKPKKKPFLCGFIRVNQRQFPDNGGPCGRSDDDIPLVHPEYPDYSNLPNDKIPLEHRRQHFQIKRIKRSEINESFETRQKRQAGFGFGYSSWASPFGFDGGYGDYYGDNYRRSYNSGYSRNRNQGYRNRYNNRYDDYDDDYQNNDDSNSRGLTGYLTNGGRRYRNRKNNNNNDDEDDDDDDDDNNNDYRDDNSEEEMERMNSNRRDNDRRNNNNNNNNNNDNRDRRRNNNNNNNNSNYNDDDDHRDNNRRNNNNNNNNNGNNNNRNNNSRRNNNNNNNNNRRYNDRNDNNNSRNRYSNGYGNNNGYGSNNGYSSNGYSSNSYGGGNGYGSSYGGYGSNYGGGYGNGGYGSSYGGNGGYGSGYGGNGGYGSSYGGNGGYGSSYGGNGGYGSSYGSNGGYGYGFGGF